MFPNNKKAIIFFTLLSLVFSPNLSCGQKKTSSDNWKNQRLKMVEDQIANRGITDKKVLKAIKKVERHLFVPEPFRDKAYFDTALPIGEDQTISQPYIVAFMTEVLNLSSKDKVLEIGTGSGYQAAILGELCDSVFTIEIFETLGTRAEELLKKLGYTNVFVKIGDGYKGWKEFAPFDAIIVTCSPTEVPDPLKDQLKEGGRMIIPVGNRFYQELVFLKKINGNLIQKEVLPVRFVPMIDSTGRRY